MPPTEWPSRQCRMLQDIKEVNTLMTIPFSVLTTSRLVLRPLTLRDAPAIQRLAGDPRVARRTASFTSPLSYPQSVKWTARALREVRACRALILAVTLRDTGEFAGVVSARLARKSPPELGYWLGVPFQGCGYCTEAVRALLRHLFRRPGVREVMGFCLEENEASARVMQRCGLYQVTRPDLLFPVRGRPERMVTYLLYREEAHLYADRVYARLRGS